jgi:hypothetical protein
MNEINDQRIRSAAGDREIRLVVKYLIVANAIAAALLIAA